MENKILYSILFLKGKNGTNFKELANLLNIGISDAKKMVNNLTVELKEMDWALEVKQSETKIRLTLTKNTSLELSKNMNKNINVSLTKSVLEALTIIAYKQPSTKTSIENIRGVAADYAISKLLEYELIESKERSESIGRPRLYTTTPTFLELFDLNSIDDLPVMSADFEKKTEEKTLFLYAEDEEDKKSVDDLPVESTDLEEKPLPFYEESEKDKNSIDDFSIESTDFEEKIKEEQSPLYDREDDKEG